MLIYSLQIKHPPTLPSGLFGNLEFSIICRHRETDSGEVNQEASEQNEVDVMKGADSTGKVLHI